MQVDPMKTLFLVRHAKSSWEEPLPDDRRPLLHKGISRTARVAEAMLLKGVSVDRIISSHAVRALETAKLLAQALDYPVEEIVVDPDIYHSGGDAIFDRLYQLPDSCGSVMIVGHNPALTDLSNRFLADPIENLPTSGVVSVTFHTDSWVDLPLAERKVRFILLPKRLD